MKVVYRGLPNDLSISIPGIPNNKLSVRATNGKVRRKGLKFEAIPWIRLRSRWFGLF